MAGTIATITAATKTELKQKVMKWARDAREMGLTDIRLGWDPTRVVKTEKGYQIEVWAHA